jgi:large subunit ribosomal protein L26e
MFCTIFLPSPSNPLPFYSLPFYDVINILNILPPWIGHKATTFSQFVAFFLSSTFFFLFFVFFPSFPPPFFLLLLQTVSSAPRKSRKAHFSAPSNVRRQIMSATLSKKLRAEHDVRSMPIRKGDTVKVVRGPEHLNGKEAKVTAVYRKKFIILLDGVAHNNAKGTSVQYPVHPSNCVITELEMTANRARILERKAAGKKASVAKKVAA